MIHYTGRDPVHKKRGAVSNWWRSLTARGDQKHAAAISKGDMARDAKNWSEAEQHYRSALNENERLAHIWMQYGHSLKEQGKFAEAEQAYRKSMEVSGETADGLLQMGHLLKLMGQPAEATAYYHKSVLLDPSQPFAAQ